MKFKINIRQSLNILHVLSWIIFIGLCIEAGSCLFSASYTLLRNPANAATFIGKHDLSGLYAYGRGHFVAETLLICIVLMIKAYLFYLIVTFLYEKKLNISQPFNRELGRFMIQASYLALATGLLTWCGAKYTEWLIKQGVKMSDIQLSHLGGADVWLFMSVTLFVIAQVFKKGIEIQSENELTI